MQVQPQTAAAMRIEGDLMETDLNIRAGMTYLRDALALFGRLDYALAGYNAGSDRVAASLRSRGRIPDIPQTKTYIRMIFSAYAALSAPAGLAALTP